MARATNLAATGAGDVDHRLLLADLPMRRADRRVGFGVGGAGLGKPCLPVGRIQRDQRVAGADRLVVLHQDRRNVALDARTENGDVALHIGVVGALDVTPLGEPPAGAHQHRGNHDHQDHGTQPALGPTASHLRRGAGCLVILLQRLGFLGNGVHGSSELNGSVSA
jgi:hypothetical protein